MFYEFTTCGAVPYAEFTNKETKAKVAQGIQRHRVHMRKLA